MNCPDGSAAMWCGPSSSTGMKPTGIFQRSAPLAGSTIATVSSPLSVTAMRPPSGPGGVGSLAKSGPPKTKRSPPHADKSRPSTTLRTAESIARYPRRMPDDPDTDALDRQVQQAFLRTNTALGENHADLVAVATTVQALVDLLVARGVVGAAELEAALGAATERLDASPLAQRGMVRTSELLRDKYEEPNAEV